MAFLISASDNCLCEWRGGRTKGLVDQGFCKLFWVKEGGHSGNWFFVEVAE
jgi:hypothetical protein